MSVDIILKHSSQASKQPDAGALKQGELAINTKTSRLISRTQMGRLSRLPVLITRDDGRYVKLAGDGTAQEITGSGGLKTKGLVEI